MHAEMLRTRLHTRIDHGVTKHDDFMGWNEFASVVGSVCNGTAGAPAALGTELGAAGLVAVARTGSGDYFNQVRPRPDLGAVVEGEKGESATIAPKTGAFCVSNDVVGKLDIGRFVVDPGWGHEFKAGSLACGEAAGAAVVKGVGVEADIGRAALDIGAPVAF